MLTRFVGSMLILVAGTGIGFSESNKMKKHVDELETLKQIFRCLKSELEYTHAPFEEVFAKLGQKFGGVFGVWLTNTSRRLRDREKATFSEIWKRSISEDLKNSFLQKKDLEELVKVGNGLGYLERIELYIEQLEYEIKNKQEDYRSKRKLCQSMGIMGGIFLVIILL